LISDALTDDILKKSISFLKFPVVTARGYPLGLSSEESFCSSSLKLQKIKNFKH
jgi:hypothetical protein